MRLLATCVLCMMIVPQLHGQHPDEAAVREIVKQYTDARDQRDANTLEALFTRDSDQQTTGGQWRHGRDAIVSGSLQSSSRNPRTRSITVESVRFVTPDVAIADGPYEQLDPTSGAAVRQLWTTFVLMRTSDGWRIAAIRNMAPTGSAASPER